MWVAADSISGDIALAARQYWYASGDKAWLEAIGFPLAKGVAEFYAKRAASRSYRVTTAKPTGGASYDINDVMGPDECTIPVPRHPWAPSPLPIHSSCATVLAAPRDPCSRC